MSAYKFMAFPEYYDVLWNTELFFRESIGKAWCINERSSNDVALAVSENGKNRPAEEGSITDARY